jgi:hypothetical protein
MSTFHQRYQAGDYINVWNEIRALGADVRSSTYREDVTRVVTETANRIRHNVDLLVERLQNDGYQFAWPGNEHYETDRSRWLPNDESPVLVDFLNKLCGPIPLIIEAWIKQVGDVNLAGNHPEWPGQDMLTDALVVEFEYKAWRLDENEASQGFFQNEYDFWKELVSQDGIDAVGPFRLPFATDVHRKVNISGGNPYAIILPDSGADALVDINGEKSYFIDYLRKCFVFGGFPGFMGMEKGRDNDTLSKLTMGLLDF